jgi:nickel-dependent lactate racemase
VLLDNGVRAQDITLALAADPTPTGEAEPFAALSDALPAKINSILHDPLSRDSLGYLAAAADGKPIYINRAIHDADLVISIGCLRPADSLGSHGINSGVFPTFSDAASLSRYQSPQATAGPERARLIKQADEVSWLLGLQFTIQVVPGAGSDVLHVLAGDLNAVVREGNRLCDEAWRSEVPERASLVVVTIEGAEHQTWDSVGRALSAASRAVSSDGAVAICADLAERPGAALQQIIGADDLDEALRELAKHPPSGALAAGELVHALRRGKVYLVSRLEEDLVEEMGISPLPAGQLSRIAARYDSCIVLPNAQYALAHVHGEPAAQPAIASSKSRK